ncbi:MAG: hypothetical protein AB1445_04585 [Bacillota bacterium]
MPRATPIHLHPDPAHGNRQAASGKGRRSEGHHTLGGYACYVHEGRKIPYRKSDHRT